MKRSLKSRVFSGLLALVMILTMLPMGTLAEGTATYTRISTVDELTSGKYVLVAQTSAGDKALGTTIGSKIDGTDVAVDGNSLSGTNVPVWTATKTEDGVHLFNGTQYLGYGSSGTNFTKPDEAYTWVVQDNGNGTFRFVASGATTRAIAWQVSNGGRFGAYALSNASQTDEYVFDLLVFQVTDGGDGGEVTPPDEPETITIAEALAAADGTADLTVKGVVTLLDGQNVYLQDSTGGICARMSAKFSDISLGDTVIATGTRETYNGLPQLNNSTYEKSSGMTLKAKTTTIGALSTADIGTYITIRNLTVTEVYDNNGAFSNPNITFKDDTGATIRLYKAVVTKNEDGSWPVAVGDVVTVTAAVSVYNGTLQLRNTSFSELQLGGTPDGAIADGDRVVIYNPGSGKALSAETVADYYRAGKDFDPATGKATSDLVWDVTVDANGNYIFSNNGDKLSVNADRNSLPLNEVNDTWKVEPATTEGCYYIINANRTDLYVEWFEKFSEFSTYKYSASNEGIYAMQFIKVTEENPGEETGMPEAGDQVVLYNHSAEGVLALQSDSQTILNAPTTVENGLAVPGNGGVVFTVEKNGEYYRFHNETFGYLCSNGTGNNAFYATEASNDADWTLAVQGTGYTLESRTAKFNGKYSQFLEYYAGDYKTYSMYNVTDYDIYTFSFLEVAEGVNVVDGVVNNPTVTFGTMQDAVVNVEYSVSFTVDAPFGIKTIEATYGGKKATLSNENTTYTFTIPAQDMVPGEMTITVTGTDNKDTAFSGEVKVEVLDEPVITKVTPASGSETLDNKRPTISAEIVNAGENPTVTMTVDGKDVKAVYENGKVSYTPAADMADGRVTVTVKVARADGKTAEKSWSFTVGKAQFQLYFGQLHSHTTYSDGSGSLEEALNYVSKLPESANVDFVAFTDHSNYFDSSSNANPEAALYDVSQMTPESKKLWDAYKGAIAAFNESQSDVIAIGGFEMTWSGGPGHINTFNTAGIVSRNNSVLNNKTSDAGLKAYYDLLSNSALADSISQFNHPGSTFGTFADFSYWNALVDTRIQLVEVGNGEGQIGAGGYYPSYEYYTMALDKGWHVAPTNNQDNHKGKWGNANDARDVILTDNFTEEGLYEAIRNYRVYSTEDKNLEIYYTVNGLQLGSIIEEVPEKLDINVLVNDPDASDSISKVEIIVNSGKVAYTWDNPAELATGNLSVTLDPTFSYYYVRVTQGDGDLAVTAPVWVGESLKLGISEVTASTSTPVTGEELTLSTKLFNSETTEATVSAVTYTVGSTVLGVDKTGYTIPASGELTVDFKWTPETAKVTKITVTAIVSLEGEEYTFTKDIELDIQDADKLVYVGIDASHYNEYVNGNYKDSMGNFGQLAAEYSVRTVILNTSEELIAACGNEKYKAIILTAPSRRDGTALRDPYLNYSDAELAALVDFNKAGGTLVLAGWSDYYEHYSSFPAEDHMAAQQNKVLEALGSSLRIGDDATNDDELNGGQTQRLYFSTYNWDNFLMEGVEFDAENPNNNLYSQLFSQYGGASIYAVDGSGNPTTTLPSTVSPVVFGHASTYSKDSDNDGIGGGSMPKYSVADGDNRLMVLATEQLEGRGLIVISGAAFMSNFEVQAQIGDNGSEKNYSNYNICENLIQYINPVEITPIQQVQDEPEEGVKFTIEGVVTSNASGYDKNTAFFDCIYLQDSTGGINAFPVAGNYKIGDILRLTGTTSSYQGERQINVTSVEKIGETTPVAPKEVTAQQINDGSVLGQLVKLKGTVVSFEKANGLVQTIIVKDAAGNEARIFIDGYITTDKDVVGLEVGCNIEVVGCASYDNSFAGEPARIRVRDRADVVCSPATTEPTDPTEPGETTQPTKPGETTQPTDPNGPDQTGESFNLVLVMVALVVSAACLVAVVVFSKKYKAR